MTTLSWERRRLAGSYSALQTLIAHNHANCSCPWVNADSSTLTTASRRGRRRSQGAVNIHELQGTIGTLPGLLRHQELFLLGDIASRILKIDQAVSEINNYYEMLQQRISNQPGYLKTSVMAHVI
jgi:hypothetical protein